MRRTLFRAGRFLILFYLGLCLLGCAFADRIIFQPPPSSYKDAEPYFKLESGREKIPVSALYLPNPKASYTILYSHGNAEDLGDIKPYLEQLRSCGFAVMAYDYRGYGASKGKASEQGCYDDIAAAYSYLTLSLGIPSSRIIVFGRSVGGGPATDLASRNPVGGLILESPFTTAFRVVTSIPLMPFDKFRNISKIGKVKCPLLVIHGTDDRVISYWHGEKLFSLANEPKKLFTVKGAGHNNLPYVAGKSYWQAIVAYAKDLPDEPIQVGKL